MKNEKEDIDITALVFTLFIVCFELIVGICPQKAKVFRFNTKTFLRQVIHYVYYRLRQQEQKNISRLTADSLGYNEEKSIRRIISNKK